MNTYKEKADKNFDETINIYEEIRQLSKLDVALKNVRDHGIDTLSLAMAVGNKCQRLM